MGGTDVRYQGAKRTGLKGQWDARFWPLADVLAAGSDVRFQG
jgi:hypothetical protein